MRLREVPKVDRWFSAWKWQIKISAQLVLTPKPGLISHLPPSSPTAGWLPGLGPQPSPPDRLTQSPPFPLTLCFLLGHRYSPAPFPTHAPSFAIFKAQFIFSTLLGVATLTILQIDWEAAEGSGQEAVLWHENMGFCPCSCVTLARDMTSLFFQSFICKVSIVIEPASESWFEV